MIKAFQTVYNFWHFKRQTCERASQSPSIKVLQWTLFLTRILYLGWLQWSHFFCYDKIWNGKIHWQMWKFFCHWILKTFCHLDRANSIKTALQTCNLSTGLSLSYKSVSWFWLNLPPQWQFFFSYLQMNIFCQFDFCHNRRNGFRLEFMNVFHFL